MVFNNLIKESLDMCVIELKKEKTKTKILSPLIDVILEKIYPYILGMCIFFSVLILLIICILYIILTK
jgi:hypothetical protein